MKKQASWKRFAGIALALLFVAAVAFAAVWYVGSREVPTEEMEPNVIVGSMENLSEAELAAKLAERVDEGMIAFSINTYIVMDSPTSQAKVKFENPANNAKLTKLEIVRDDTGETIYSTGLVVPGSYVNADMLDVELAPGKYACTATISSYAQDTKKYLGKAAAALTIHVLAPQ